MGIYKKITGKLGRIASRLKQFAIVAAYNGIRRPWSAMRFTRRLSEHNADPAYLTKYSDVTRDIEILDRDFDLEEVVFACYFTKRIDPQSGILRSIPDINYISPWYKSIKKLEINGIIIHDGIDEDFIKQYETDKIQFRKYTAGKYAIFDERWMLYYLFISKTNIRRAFCTDISDVYITADPFVQFNKDEVFYIGRDNANKIRQSGWMLAEIDIYMKNSGFTPPASFYFQPLYNVGIAGGSRKIMLFFLSKVIEYILLTETERYKEMTIFNLVIHKYFYPKLKYSDKEPVFTDPENDQAASNAHLFSGFPLNSAFKKFDNDSKAVFIHK
ncbi:MAG: hypothetical protein WCM76_00945 [Bacteroidota bacterium]